MSKRQIVFFWGAPLWVDHKTHLLAPVRHRFCKEQARCQSTGTKLALLDQPDPVGTTNSFSRLQVSLPQPHMVIPKHQSGCLLQACLKKTKLGQGVSLKHSQLLCPSNLQGKRRNLQEERSFSWGGDVVAHPKMLGGGYSMRSSCG